MSENVGVFLVVTHKATTFSIDYFLFCGIVFCMRDQFFQSEKSKICVNFRPRKFKVFTFRFLGSSIDLQSISLQV